MNQVKVVAHGANETVDISLPHYYSNFDGIKQTVLI
jgi:hypothetical protein